MLFEALRWITLHAMPLLQELQPAVPLPPPLGSLLRQLACRQLRGIFQDLHQEAARINSGRPTLVWGQPGKQRQQAPHE